MYLNLLVIGNIVHKSPWRGRNFQVDFPVHVDEQDDGDDAWDDELIPVAVHPDVVRVLHQVGRPVVRLVVVQLKLEEPVQRRKLESKCDSVNFIFLEI